MGMAKYERLLYILTLLRSRRNLNAASLAHECGVAERSIYRDIIALSEANVPIYYDNGYKLASDNFLPPLNFTFEEYNALQLALESTPLNRTEKYSVILKRIRAKVESNLPANVRDQKKRTARTTRIDIDVSARQKQTERYFGVIEEAITGCHCLEIDYLSVSSGLSTRTIEPYFIVFRGRAFYVVAYCRRRKDFRTFRIDQMQQVTPLPETFAPKTGISAESYFDGSWQVFGGDPVEVVVRFTGTAARVVSSRSHHPDESVEKLAGGDVLYRVTVKGIEEIQRWIVGFGADATVIAPPELRRNLAELAHSLASTYLGDSRR